MQIESAAFDFHNFVKIDFSTWNRYRVISKENVSSKFVKLNLVLEKHEDVIDYVLLGFPWNQINVQPNDIVSVIGKYDEEEKSFVLSSDFGLLIVNPDYMISSTKVSQSLFCQRKSVLSEKFQMHSVGSLQMVIGVLVHELFQKALTSMLTNGTKPNVIQMCDEILKSRELAFMCYENFLCVEMVKKPLMDFMLKINNFLTFNMKNPLQENQNQNQDGTCLKIDKIYDIEENVWSPNLGLKGKVDVTVHLHGRTSKSVTPFELKTGKASLEHRAQIILYVVMMKHIKCDVNSGLLYYLQDNVISEIEANHNEVRDLILSRNELVHYLSRYETELISSECQQSQSLRLMKLPAPLTRELICEKCEYNFICATYHCSSADSDKSMPIHKIGEKILRHLSKEDFKYFFKWTEILFKEEEVLSQDTNINELWTQSPCDRFNCGQALIDLTLTEVVKHLDGNFIHTFQPASGSSIDHVSFEVGQYVIISTSERLAITTGILTCYKEECIEVSLERDLKVKNPHGKFIIDKYYARNLLNLCYGNIALLMQDTPPSNHLRKIIVNKLPSEFSENIQPNLSSSIALNELQKKIVGRAVNCKNYMLINGYAGTGKTETIVAIISALYAQGKSVIITSHTHSAIDNILLKLQKTELKFLRIGKLSRIMAEIKEFSEYVLTKDCKSPADFESVYAQYRIVAATCYGTVHPLFARRMFDVCIVDEATQVTQPLIVRSLLCAKKFILVGDPFQLPPVVKSNDAKLLGGDQSLFCWLDSDAHNIELRAQYRMNIQIANLANEFTYIDKLIVGEMKDTIDCSDELVQFSWEERIFSSNMKDSALFLDTGYAYDRNMDLMKNKVFSEHMSKISKIGHNVETGKKVYVNLLEAVFVLHMISKFLKCHITVQDIGVIATYRSQVDCIKSMAKNIKQFKNLEINTVDQYQGRDKQIIIYSCTKTKRYSSNVGNKISTNEILDDHRRLTVAITRAKRKLIIIGDYSSVLENAPLKRLFECTSAETVQISDSFYDQEWSKFFANHL